MNLIFVYSDFSDSLFVLSTFYSRKCAHNMVRLNIHRTTRLIRDGEKGGKGVWK